MKKGIGLLTIVACITVFIGARDMKKNMEQATCSPEKIKDEIAHEQETCDRVKDDPYEDLICERSQLKIRRRVKELEECEQHSVDQKSVINGIE